MARDQAWKAAHYDVPDIYALRALKDGKATPEQQQRAMDWIIDKACAFREEPFRGNADGGERETSFVLGRQSVARQIVYLLTLPEKLISELRKNDG